MADEELLDARRRATEAVCDWARSTGYEDPVVVSYLIVTEIVTSNGRGVVWVTGDANEPSSEDEAGLHRWRVRGLMGEVDAQIRERTVRHEGDDG